MRFFFLVHLRLMPLLAMTFLVETQAAEPTSKRVADAVLTDTPPVIDGILDDQAWKNAVWYGDFVQRTPVNGAEPSFDTKIAVAFDDHNIYFAARCFVDDKSSIVARLIRRDRWADFDHLDLFFSPRGDGLTGYEFSVNPLGVQRDMAFYDDDEHDRSWDAVWSAQTTISEKEWTVEMAIPLDQMRFSGDAKEWGFQVNRWISSLQEKVDFNWMPIGKSGWVSKAGALAGVEEIEPRRPVSLIPETYFSYRTATSDYGGLGKDGFSYGAGGYGKVGLGSDSVLDFAVNPDFGQVEVDEAVLNLSAYETRFPEKRPFFLESAGLFRTPIQLFYSRRIGAPPPYPTLDSDEYVTSGPSSTPILAATKFTGRSQNGISVGAIEAITLPTEFTVEDDVTGESHYVNGSPFGSTTVLRVNTEPSKNANIGALVTAFNPAGSGGSYTGGLDWSLFALDKEYAFRGQVVGSTRYEGVFEKEETKGAGIFSQIGREGGEHFRFNANYQFYSDGFDPNDLGYLRRDDLHQYSLFLRLQKMEKWGPFSEFHFTAIPNGKVNTDGLNLDQEIVTVLFGKWLNGWVSEIGTFVGVPKWDDRESRGGPPIKYPGFIGGWLMIRSPERSVFGGRFSTTGHNMPYGYALNANLDILLRFSRLELELSPEFEHTVGGLGYVDTLTFERDVQEIFVIGRRDLDQFDLGLKGTFLITRDLSVQLLAQLLSVSADYSNYQQLNSDSSTTPYDYPDDSADFVHTDLILQALLRWEYSPGSTLYAVYTHFGYYDLYQSHPDLVTGIRNLDQEEREQLFMIKLSHRFGL